jgi:transposase InsO family protein
MSDNAKCYATSHEFRDVLGELAARHILIPPYTPCWNGKIERFFATLDTEWAHGRVWPNSTHATAPWHPSCALQPQATALSRRRPTTHQPRSAGPRAGQLRREPTKEQR